MPSRHRVPARSSVLVNAARAVVRAGVALALTLAPASAAPATIFHLPSNYMSRFGTSEIAFTADTGYGVRYLPLPTDPDVRLSVVRHANYWEVNLGSRVNDTTLAGGVYFNGAGAAAGIPRMEYTHNADVGVQYSALVQGGGLHSHVNAGYAARVLDGQVRVLGVAGVATQGDVVAPYAQAEVGGGFSRTFGIVNAYVGTTLRTSAFPVQGQALGNVDVYVAATARPAPGVTLAASHFERLVVGSTPLADFGMSRHQESSASALYRLPARDALVALAGVRARGNRNWTSDTSYVWADVLLDVRGLPTLAGPGVGYQFGPGGAGRWLFTLVTLGR